MINFLKWFFLTLSIMLIWTLTNVVITKQGWFTAPIAQHFDDNAFMKEAKKNIKQKSKGNAVMLLIKGGQIIGDYAISKDQPVNRNSVFGVSSLSKWVTAIGVMTLVEKGLLDLDAPVSNYLKRWQLPASDFNNNEVTVRRLLSHTSGITDGLGHNGFKLREEIQPLIQHLTKAKDADEGADGRVKVGITPGSTFNYSGGSYNLIQLLVEDITNMPFEAYMFEAIFEPLKMHNTSYRHNEVKQLAQYFDENGKIRNYPFYTSLAATGLYTSANDLQKLIRLHLPEEFHQEQSSNVISLQSLKEMRLPHASNYGIDIWGLGAMLFASNNQDDFIIGHGGKSPSLNATVRLNPFNGNGIIMLSTGNSFLAADTATQWTLWETANPDMYMLANMIPAMMKRVLIGCAFILVLSLIIAWCRKNKKQIKDIDKAI